MVYLDEADMFVLLLGHQRTRCWCLCSIDMSTRPSRTRCWCRLLMLGEQKQSSMLPFRRIHCLDFYCLARCLKEKGSSHTLRTGACSRFQLTWQLPSHRTAVLCRTAVPLIRPSCLIPSDLCRAAAVTRSFSSIGDSEPAQIRHSQLQPSHLRCRQAQ